MKTKALIPKGSLDQSQHKAMLDNDSPEMANNKCLAF